MPFLQQSAGATLNGGNYIDMNGSNNIINFRPDTRKGEGIRLLRESYVQHEAIHDSGARGALGCHSGTREEYIRRITSWGTGIRESEKRAFLMTGPAGAGKSAIAQTCAHNLEAVGHLGASFAFFRPSGWNNPKKFISTIVYQLATRYRAYRDHIDAIIIDDPLVLEKAMDIQFRELLIKPLQHPSVTGGNIKMDAVIIIDGLDECATAYEQVRIIDLIATSIRERTTPFLWAFFSRPEPPITSAFSSKIDASVAWELPLTLSGGDADIETYLRSAFGMIRAKYNIPASVIWPTEDDTLRLVSQSAGLFVYAVTAIRYIDKLGEGSSGLLEQRLRAVLQLDSTSTGNPFSALDQLYTLIMMLIPEGVLYDTLSLLLLHQNLPESKLNSSQRERLSEGTTVYSCCFALGLSLAAFHVSTSNLLSVLEVTMSANGLPAEFQFYHKSFLDFLLNPWRSQRYCIRSPGVQRQCLEMILRTMSASVCTGTNAANTDAFNHFTLQAFFTTVQGYYGELEENILQQISNLNWSRLHRQNSNEYAIYFPKFIQKV